jgi:conjugal transfer pilus assembly protein TraE
MKLAWLRQDLEGARRAVAVLLLLLIGSMLVNVVLAGLATRLSNRERVVVVPPVVHKSFWLDTERVSGEYLEQMAYFLVQLVLNVTPQNVDHQAKVLLQYAAPSAYGELRATLQTAAERLKRDSATTVFSARDLMVDEAAMRVAVRGQLTTFVSDRRVSETNKAYLIEFQYTGGRIHLKTFRETATNDPLEAKPVLGVPAPGA